MTDIDSGEFGVGSRAVVEYLQVLLVVGAGNKVEGCFPLMEGVSGNL